MRGPANSLMRPDVPRSRAAGVVAALAAIAVTTVVIYPLGEVVPAVSTGVVYLLAVLLVSTYWGLWLGLPTAVGSAATFNWFHIPPTGRFHVEDPEHWVALGVFLVAAVIASTVAEVARSRTAEAERRGEESGLSADMASVLLGGATLSEALDRAGHQLAEALDLESARFEIGGDAREPDAICLDLGPAGSAALHIPPGTDTATRQRLTDHVVPSLEALLAAALERDRLQGQSVETEALRRSDVLKTALLRTVSHDLRSPLTAIIAAGEAVRSPTLDASDREELGSLIVVEARRLSRLVEQLLDLSRLQAGTAAPRSDWCSIEEVVTAAVEQLGPEAAPIQVTIDSELPLVKADAGQLERVFVNLLENASRFSGGHPVKVRARDIGGRIAVRVVDRGPGIAELDLPHIFAPFHQGAQQDEHAGSGLGLAIVKGLIEANGGRVYAESQPGHGSVFAVELPVIQETAAAPAYGALA